LGDVLQFLESAAESALRGTVVRLEKFEPFDLFRGPIVGIGFAAEESGSEGFKSARMTKAHPLRADGAGDIGSIVDEGGPEMVKGLLEKNEEFGGNFARDE
jgi:hypothetical protein